MTTVNQEIVPFLHPHEINLIRKRLHTLIGAFYTTGDNRVLRAAKDSIMQQLLEHFTDLTAEQRALLEEAGNVRDKEELMFYLAKLAPYVIPLPTITAAEIRKLFPKVKKLTLPNLEALEYSTLTYIGWRDIATNSLYLVHRIGGKWVGTECKYVLGPKNRTFMCKWCNQPGAGDEIALVTTQVKNRAILDGYKSIGNHFCLNSDRCNQHLTTTEDMEAFLHSLKR
ncbi:MAG: FusB/FusC family EF-G-binding protein [Tumebacillaceae bacterium]